MDPSAVSIYDQELKVTPEEFRFLVVFGKESLELCPVLMWLACTIPPPLFRSHSRIPIKFHPRWHISSGFTGTTTQPSRSHHGNGHQHPTVYLAAGRGQVLEVKSRRIPENVSFVDAQTEQSELVCAARPVKWDQGWGKGPHTTCQKKAMRPPAHSRSWRHGSAFLSIFDVCLSAWNCRRRASVVSLFWGRPTRRGGEQRTLLFVSSNEFMMETFFLFRGNDARMELEEYQESSREVEAELEAQLKQAEQQVRELRSNNHRLHFEHNSLKVINIWKRMINLAVTVHIPDVRLCWFDGSRVIKSKYGSCLCLCVCFIFARQEKYDALSREHITRVQDLEAQVNQLKAKVEESTKRIRELEQNNDDLERANRYVGVLHCWTYLRLFI